MTESPERQLLWRLLDALEDNLHCNGTDDCEWCDLVNEANAMLAEPETPTHPDDEWPDCPLCSSPADGVCIATFDCDTCGHSFDRDITVDFINNLRAKAQPETGERVWRVVLDNGHESPPYASPEAAWHAYSHHQYKIVRVESAPVGKWEAEG